MPHIDNDLPRCLRMAITELVGELVGGFANNLHILYHSKICPLVGHECLVVVTLDKSEGKVDGLDHIAK